MMMMLHSNRKFLMPLNTKIKIYYIILLSISNIGCTNLNHNRERKYYHITLDSAYCNDQNLNRFLQICSIRWPQTKPRSVEEAVELLDSIVDDNGRNIIVNCNPTELYFNLGLKIRNEWVSNGDSQMQYQIYQELKITNPEYSSGLILNLYRELLIGTNLNFVPKLKTKDPAIIKEIVKIQEKLKMIRKDMHIVIIKK